MANVSRSHNNRPREKCLRMRPKRARYVGDRRQALREGFVVGVMTRSSSHFDDEVIAVPMRGLPLSQKSKSLLKYCRCCVWRKGHDISRRASNGRRERKHRVTRL
ncbi:hypothetical protein PUN28_016157 [Cardiocondyla obscurior]|uniref:Uncharacterized protein n=1 Tax=Cardiocondyla obscurior TaxID=286306 RepID=A0AAW2ETT2_9HYME